MLLFINRLPSVEQRPRFTTHATENLTFFFLTITCLIYRSPSDSDSSASDFLSSCIEYLLATDPKCLVTKLGDFIVRNRDLLVHSSDTPLWVEEPNNYPWSTNWPPHTCTRRSWRLCSHSRSWPHSVPFFCSDISVLIPLGSSDYCVITSSINLTSHDPPIISKHNLTLQSSQLERF